MSTTRLRRESGVILHPTSLPGPHGIGDCGPSAYHFVDWLAGAGQSCWQMLPLNPIGPGNSPYASVSAFAASPLLVALEPLAEAGWLAPPDAADLASFDPRKVDFERVVPWRMDRLRDAAEGFSRRADAATRARFAAYREAQRTWLDDYALFMALDTAQRRAAHAAGREAPAWPQWPAPLARREPAAMAAAREEHAGEIRFWQFVQWCFGEQWARLRQHARERGVRLVGDLPIFVAHHSADCWARPDLYRLDAAFAPTVVAGVPPDFFSATGQRWGNPLYDWDAMARDGYAWWIARLRRQLDLADIVRIDHFRGFAAYWEIDAACETAVEGTWRAGPGAALFERLRDALGGELPVIAEDLGIITPDVEALRDGFGLPGMRVLQFAFGESPDHLFLPHNYIENCCVYTGTHDNDTVVGWWATAAERERRYASQYLDLDGHDIHWAMVRAACASVARLAIYPLQDVLGLDASHRMNTPALTGCWTWRFEWNMVGPEPGKRLAEMAACYGRRGGIA
ncbi:MAG TPA: 4-alpha-glucanotransferase [Burkholderiaceae bacterium]|nr:4-alpha-glucanotransferase [Burkholderiaceae bacterium]